jgi:hypothetical protein
MWSSQEGIGNTPTLLSSGRWDPGFENCIWSDSDALMSTSIGEGLGAKRPPLLQC